jgi:endonuclease/exonuclease/phosphatase family metal-dependent hydrolase
MSRGRYRLAVITALAAACLSAAAPAHALRVATWNLLGYDDTAVPSRRPQMIQVVPGLNPDVMIVQELFTSTAADSFANLLKATMPGRVWKGGSSTFILGTQSAMYYDSLKVSISNLTAVTTGGPRQVLVALVRPVGYLANAASFRLYSVHFKAGDGAGGVSPPSDSSQRTLECTNLRNTLNAAPAGTNLLVGGDTNFYGSFETGYTRLTESQADNDGRMKDPQTISGLWNNPAFAPLHSQSPCAGAGCIGSSGGMDDRFDIVFSSFSLNDGQGLDMVSGSLPNGYGPYGNDGLHYNDSIDGGGINTAVGPTVATALRLSSDHLPVIATLQLPAKLACSNRVDFGDVIVGGNAVGGLMVDDLPPPPAATLSYSLVAPAGFSAPSGTLNNAAASPPDLVFLGMNTATVGVKTGTLTVNSNDLDTTAKSVPLSGRVLAHAVPSLDSSATTTVRALDFGTVDQNSVTEHALRLFNRGYSPLQARLVRTTEYVAQIPVVLVSEPHTSSSGPGFSFTGPPATPITDAATYAITFDATGGAPGQPYAAELRIAPADEPLPGALAYDTLRVSLSATIRDNGGVGGLPTVLRFAPPAPNPVHGVSRFAFDLPEAAAVSLAIYDAGGRRMAQLASGDWPAGRHHLDWRAVRDDGRAIPAGLYFASFKTRGLERVARLIVLP